MPDASLQQLLRRPDLWQGLRHNGSGEERRPTGLAELDRVLRGGWPAAGLTELLCTPGCVTTLHLLLPALAEAGREGPVFLVNPPLTPFAPALESRGLAPSRVRILRAARRETLLRAAREAAASQAVPALVLWSPGRPLPGRELGRLHRAARAGRCLLLLIQPLSGAPETSPAPVRLELAPHPSGKLRVQIRKHSGGRAGQVLQLDVLPDFLRHPPPETAAMAPPGRMKTPTAQQVCS